MPQIQVVDTTRDKPEPTGVEELFSKLGKSYKDRQDQNVVDTLIADYKKNRDKAYAWEDFQLGLEQSTISPTKRLQTQQSLNEMKKLITEQDKALNAKFRANAMTQQERERRYNDLITSGMPAHEARIYLDAAPGERNSIRSYHNQQVSRGLRSPLPDTENEGDPSNQSQMPQESIQQPQSPDESYDFEIGKPEPSNQASNDVQSAQMPQSQKLTEIPSEKEEWPVIPPPAETTAAEREKGRAVNQKENSKILQDNHKKVIAIRDDQLAIRRLQQLNDSKKLPSGIERWITVNPETGDIRTTAKLIGKANPETQAYVKEINKFIRNAKDYYGARVTNFDLQTFLAQLPTLANTEEGRRLILKQMDQESKLQGIYANKMDEAIKHYGRNANIIDISKVVDDQIGEEESDLIKKMDYTIQASNFTTKMIQNPQKFSGSVLMQTPDGQFKAVKKDLVPKYEAKDWSVY